MAVMSTPENCRRCMTVSMNCTGLAISLAKASRALSMTSLRRMPACVSMLLRDTRENDWMLPCHSTESGVIDVPAMASDPATMMPMNSACMGTVARVRFCQGL
eukprot:m51a1_g11346 hypothetical protein (103) ;mRNA; f:120-428